MSRLAEPSKYLIFLGCVIPYRVSAYEISARKILHKLGAKLVEMPEFNCCGLPFDPVDHKATLVMAARNLALAEDQGLDILTLCPGCTATLRKANKALKEDEALRKDVNSCLNDIGLNFGGTGDVKHLIQVLTEDFGLQEIESAVTKPLTMLKVAEHCGCHLLRPREISGSDDPEDPKLLRALIGAAGPTCLDYMDETECCGAPSIGVDDRISLQLVKDKLSHIRNVGAHALITVCPFCHMMYDTNQRRVEEAFGENYGIPVLHYSQLLGLALGIMPHDLALRDLRVDSSAMLERIQGGRKADG